MVEGLVGREQLVQDRGWNALSGVYDRNAGEWLMLLQLAPLVLVNGYGDPALERVLERIADQVDDDLPEPVFVCTQMLLGLAQIDAASQVDAFAVGLELEQIRDFRDQRLDVE